MLPMKITKISDKQLKAITAAYVCGSSTIIISSSVTALAKQDSWISAILTTLIGLVLLWLNTFLASRYPDKTYIEIIETLLGKWFGGFVSINLIILSLIGASDSVWYIGDLFTTQYVPEASAYPYEILFVVILVIAMMYGLETFARASVIFYYIILFLFVISVVFLIPNIDIDKLLPILENGFTPVLKGTIPLMSFTLMPLILLNMIFPVYVTNIEKAKIAMFKGYLVGMLIMFFSMLMCNLVLGSAITANLRYPVLVLAKEINIGTILSRLEPLTVSVWLLTIFNKTFFYFYAGVVGLSLVLKLKDYRKIVLPLGLIVAVVSDFIYRNVSYQINWDTTVLFPYTLTFGFSLPIILLIVSIIKKSLKSP